MQETREKRPSLIFFVDAFGFDYLAQRVFLPGFWDAELPLETLLGYSSSIVPALWSGQRPQEMNAWNEFFYRPRARLIDFLASSTTRPIPICATFCSGRSFASLAASDGTTNPFLGYPLRSSTSSAGVRCGTGSSRPFPSARPVSMRGCGAPAYLGSSGTTITVSGQAKVDPISWTALGQCYK